MGRLRFFLFFICLLFVISICPAVAADKPNAPLPQSITVAAGASYPPFYFLNNKKLPDGFLVDLWRLWSRQTGVPVVFKTGPFNQTLQWVRQGEVNAHAGCFFSEQRAEYLDFAAPLAKVDTSIFFQKDIYGIDGVHDLQGFEVGVVRGDYAQTYLQERAPAVRLVLFDDNKDLFQALVANRIKVFVCDTPVALYFLNKNNKLSEFNYNPSRPVYSNTYTAAVRKGDSALAALLKTGFSRIDPNQIQAVRDRWFNPATTTTKDSLTIAADRNFRPFTWLTSEGRPSGILIDLWRLWSSKTGRRINFLFGDRMQSIYYLRDGRANIHAGLFKTEGEGIVDFSLPVFPAEVDYFYPSGNKEPNLSDMSGRRVGVFIDSVYADLLSDLIPNALILAYRNYDEMMVDLAKGRLDGVADVALTVTAALHRLGLAGRAVRHPHPLAVKTIYAAAPKGNEELMNVVNQGLRDIPQSDIVGIEQQWVPAPEMRRYQLLIQQFRLSPEEKTWLAAHKTIRLGPAPDNMPFEGFDANGEFQGISSGYTALIGQMMNVAMTTVKTSSPEEMRDQILNGNIDVLPGLIATPERAEYLSFTRPYLSLPSVLITKQDHPVITGLTDMRRRRVAVVKGDPVEAYIRKNHPKINLVSVDSPEEGLRAVAAGEVEACLDNRIGAQYRMRKEGIKGLYAAADTKFVAELAMGVRKDWPELLAILEKALQSLTAEQKSLITNRWLNVQFQERINWGPIITFGGIAAAVLAMIIAVIIVWNRRLAKEVDQRKAAEDRFRTMAASVPGSLIQIRGWSDGKWEYVYLSAKCADFFEAPPEQVIADQIRLNWLPEDRDRIDREIKTALAKKTTFNLVGRIISSSGRQKWIRITTAPGSTKDGATTYNGFILDITERKQAEKEYLASERKIKAMSQAVDDALIMIDSRGRVLFWNQAAEKLFGYKEEEALGLDFHSMAAPDEYHDRIAAGLPVFAETGRGPVLGVTTEIAARNRQGSEFPVEVTLSSFQLDEEWYAVGTVRDISARKRAEEEIKQSREDFRIIADYTYDWEGWHNPEGELLWVNPAVERITGYSVDECMAMPDYPLPLIHPEDRKIWLASLEQAKAGQDGTNVSFRTTNRTGREYWISLSWNPVRDSDGVFTGFRTSARDFTEQKLAVDQLRFTQYTVDKAVQSVFWLDPDAGTFTYVNDAACRTLDYSREELLSMTLPQIDLNLTSETMNQYIDKIRKNRVVQQETTLHTAAGLYLDVECSAYLAAHGDKEVVIIFAKDITEEKLAAEALRESEERSRMLLRSVDEGIFGVDPDGRVTFINPAALRMLDFREDELRGRKIHDLIHHSREDGSEYPLAECPMYMSSSRGTTHKVDNEVLWTKKGSCFPVDYSSTPIRQGEKILGAVITFRDITEQQEAARQIEENRSRLETALEASNTGLWDWRPRDGEHYLSDQWFRQLGYARSEFQDIEDPLLHLMHPDDREGFNEAMKSYSGGNVDAYSQEFRLKAKDGSWKWILSRGRILERDKSGDLRRLIGVHLDMTASKQAAQEMQENLDELERFNRLVVGRELKMIQLKEEINGLLEKLGRKQRYKIVE